MPSQHRRRQTASEEHGFDIRFVSSEGRPVVALKWFLPIIEAQNCES